MTYETLAQLEEVTETCATTRAALERLEAKRAAWLDLREDLLEAAAITPRLYNLARDCWQDWDNQLSDLLGDIRGEMEEKQEELEEDW